MKRAIIIGATSFIGIALIKRLITENYQVTGVIRPFSSRLCLLRRLYPNVSWLECELNELDRLRVPRMGYDALFHIGWASDFPGGRNNRSGQFANIRYCRYAVELAARSGCTTYLSIGSQAECGIVSEPITPYTDDNPLTAYGEAKCMASDETARLCKEYGIQHYWPRLLSAYGPYDRETTMIMSCIKACKTGKRMELTAAEQVWDYVYVDDAANALRLIVEQGVPSKKYPIASGVGRPLKEYIWEIAKATQCFALLDAIGLKAYTKGQVMYLVGDINELCIDTGFQIKYSFEKGIVNTVKFYE